VHTPGFASVHTREWPLHVRSGRRLKKKWMSMADVAATKASIMLVYHRYRIMGGLRDVLSFLWLFRSFLLLYGLKVVLIALSEDQTSPLYTSAISAKLWH
jgi:hypothetical protein